MNSRFVFSNSPIIKKLTQSVFLAIGIVASLSYFLLPESASAARIINFKSSPRLSIRFNTEYDRNIFLYSDQYLQEFKNQIRPYRFPFRTYDDLIVRLNLSLQTPIYWSGHRTDFILSYRPNLYSVNTQKSYQIISAQVNHPLSKKIRLEAVYLFLPSYLVRYYRNPLGALSDYIGCTFSENLATARFRYHTAKINIAPFFQYELDDYVKNFNFYDGYALRYGINSDIKSLDFINIRINLARKNYFANGPVPDISYRENRISLALKPVLSQSKLSASAQLSYTARQYTTKLSFENDPYHRDRNDTKYTANIDLSYRISKNMHLVFGYECEQRRTKTPYQIDIEDIKDYNNNKYLLGIRFNPNLSIESNRPSFSELGED